jgi:hypothetical protein
MKLVIPSRGRSKNVRRTSSLFPSAFWCVAKGEAEDYLKAGVPKNLLVTHGDNEAIGIASKRQWIIDKFKGETTFQLDDDIYGVWSMTNKKGRPIEGAGNILRLIENAAEISRGIGATVFGFCQVWDVRKSIPMNPVAFHGWVGTAIGIHPSKVLRYDTELKTQADIDFCLKALLLDRIIYVDNRFGFMCERFSNSGGSAGIRDEKTYREQCDLVKKRWGQWISVKKAKTTIRIAVHVNRRQPLEIYR